MAMSDAAKAGVAVFVGGVQFAVFLIVAEALYPGYSVSLNYVSDLGATCSATPCYIPPSAGVFAVSVALFGLLILVGSYFIQRSFKWMPATGLIAIAGIGLIGVGAFPETTGSVHSLFSLIVFLFAGLSAVVAFWLQRPPMSYFSVILGVATLASLLLYLDGTNLGLGVGGMERMVVYPVLLWAIGFGGHLMGLEDKPHV